MADKTYTLVGKVERSKDNKRWIIKRGDNKKVTWIRDADITDEVRPQLADGVDIGFNLARDDEAPKPDVQKKAVDLNILTPEEASENGARKGDNKSAENEERMKLEVFTTPIGGDEGNQWNISVELEKNEAPMAGKVIMIIASADVPKQTLEISESGCAEETVTITEDTYVRFVYDSTLSISDIPLAGPDKKAEDRPPLTKWEKWSNRIWVAVTLVTVISFVILTVQAVRYISTPYEDREEALVAKPAANSNSSNSNSSASRPFVPYSQTIPASDSPSAANNSEKESGWLDHTPAGSWFWFTLLLVFNIVLTPICFWDDAWRALTRVYMNSEVALKAWQHKRENANYSVEIVRNSGKLNGKPTYTYKGEPSGEPMSKDKATQMLRSSFESMKNHLIKWEFLAEFAGVLFDRLVLGKILGGRR